MKKNKFNKKSKLVLLLLLIVGISIGYAALSSTLNINGNTNIKTAKWDIHFENLEDTHRSKARISTFPEIDTTKMLIEYAVILQQPGDFYEFTVDVVNAGSIDAMVSKVVKTGIDDSQSKYITYTTTYADGTEVKEKDKLSAGDKKSLKVRVKYKYDLNSADLPTEDKPISLTFQVIYVQADETAKVVLPEFPTYFAFGTPTTSSTTDYKTLGKTVFNALGSDGSTGVCIDDNGLFCLKPNEFEKSKSKLIDHFDHDKCLAFRSSSKKDVEDVFQCYSYLNSGRPVTCDVWLDGTVDCYLKSGDYCEVTANNSFSCN